MVEVEFILDGPSGHYDKSKEKNKDCGAYFEKEYHHTKHNESGKGSDGYQKHRMCEEIYNPDALLPKDLINKWIGAKFIVYDTIETTDEKIDNKYVNAVRCEMWMDKNAEQVIKDDGQQNKPEWQLLNVVIDKGHEEGPKFLGDKLKSECDAIGKSQIFSWGGPSIHFRIDYAEVEVKYASIREIIPPKNTVLKFQIGL